MASKRKTYSVNDLTMKVNGYIKAATISTDEKRALCILIESVLHETGNYQGFSYNFDWNKATEEEQNDGAYDRNYYVGRG
jgi:hypothetical protein